MRYPNNVFIAIGSKYVNSQSLSRLKVQLLLENKQELLKTFNIFKYNEKKILFILMINGLIGI